MTERWLPVVGYEGRYEVSDAGQVRSLTRTVTSVCNGKVRHAIRKGKVLKTALTPFGKLQVCLSNNGQEVRLVHHLVLEAFVGPRPVGMECCHANDIGHDNRLQNLRWDTRRENILDQVKNGRHHAARKTHCKSGHEFNSTNTRVRLDGISRTCRQCERIRREKRAA